MNEQPQELYISQQTSGWKRRNKLGRLWSFKITRNYVTHSASFKTFEEACAYKKKWLMENTPQNNNQSGERYIRQFTPGKRRNKLTGLGWEFRIVRNYVVHSKYFKTFEEACAYKKKWLMENGVGE